MAKFLRKFFNISDDFSENRSKISLYLNISCSISGDFKVGNAGKCTE